MIEAINSRDTVAKARIILEKAVEASIRKTCPIRVNDRTTIYITEEQAADPAYMKRFWERWRKISL